MLLPGAFHQFLLGTLEKKDGTKCRSGKRLSVKETSTCYLRSLRKLSTPHFVDTCHLVYTFLNDSLDEERVRLCRRLKKILRTFHGRVEGHYHNFCTDMPLPSNPSVKYYVDKVKLRGQYYSQNYANFHSADPMEFFVIAFHGNNFLHGMCRRFIGLAIAIIRGKFESDISRQLVLQDFILDLKPLTAPAEFLFLSECEYKRYEIKYNHSIQPRAIQSLWNKEIAPPIAEEVFNYRSKLLERMGNLWMENRDVLWQWIGRIDSFTAKLKAVSQFYTKRNELPAAIKLSKQVNSSNVYSEVLDLLRHIHRSGQWPTSHSGRRQLIVQSTSKKMPEISGTGGIDVSSTGGSFSLGSMPPPLSEPQNNKKFSKLLKAVFELERHLMPHRPPSSTIAINCNAQFKPHRDSGAGAGQLQSMIVGLGDYVGGELVVESEVHDIQYQPMEFNGWKQRHWTLPFSGERFSLVWFTPKGCENVNASGLEIAKKYQ